MTESHVTWITKQMLAHAITYTRQWKKKNSQICRRLRSPGKPATHDYRCLNFALDSDDSLELINNYNVLVIRTATCTELKTMKETFTTCMRHKGDRCQYNELELEIMQMHVTNKLWSLMAVHHCPTRCISDANSTFFNPDNNWMWNNYFDYFIKMKLFIKNAT